MKPIINKYATAGLLLAVTGTTNAGHLFTQASSNTPTWIQSGQGIVIDQYGDEGGSGTGAISIDFEANIAPPNGADTSTSDWWSWSAGDVMRINLPLSNATYTYTIAYDAASGTCAYDYCGQTYIGINSSTLGDSGVTLPTHTGERSSYTSSDTSFTWSIEALAGEFSLGGYRLRTSGGTIDGTGAGPLDQSSVVSAEEVAQGVTGGSSIPDIDTTQTEYTASDVNNNLVNPKFTGGTLAISSGSVPISTNFTVDANGGTIQADADIEISGVLSDDSSSSGGSLTKTGSASLTLSGDNTFTGDLIVEEGILVADGSLTGSVVVNANGMLKGSGTVSGITSDGTIAPGNSPGTLTSSSSIVLNSGSTLQEEIDGLTYNPAGGAGSYDRIAVTGAGSTFTADGTLEILLRGISGAATNTFTPSIGDQFRIVTTEEANGVLGNFALVTQPTDGLSGNTRFDVLYGANFIDLVLTPESYAAYAAINGNQNSRDAMTALDAIRPAAGVVITGVDPFSGLTGLSEAQLNTAIAQLSGEIHAQSANDVKDQIVSLSNIVLNASRTLDPEERLWFNVNYNRLNYRDDKIATGYDSNASAIVVGYDLERQLNQRYGLGVSYIASDLSSALGSSSENQLASVFAYFDGSRETENLGTLNLSLNAGIGLSYREMARNVALSSGVNVHESKTNESLVFGQARISRLFVDSDKAQVTGYTGLRVQSLKGDAYTENGSSDTALSVASNTQTSGQLELGALVSLTNSDTVSWNLDAGLYSELISDNKTLDRDVTLGAANWTVQGTDTGDIGAKIAAHGNWAVKDNITGFVNLSITGTGHRSEGQASLGISVDL
ncbi:MAG: autotransporter domain-containing protein [Oceanospirillales bacterium]|nr:autotransporter domain-containing protein [Oceanospirillales bacterium]MBR9889331.1 autotransporter domain-containing protein [Oceanospirillales bacterium]